MLVNNAIVALSSLAALALAAPTQIEVEKRATSFSGYLHATRLHGSPAFNKTLEYNNDGNLGVSNPNNGFNYVSHPRTRRDTKST